MAMEGRGCSRTVRRSVADAEIVTVKVKLDGGPHSGEGTSTRLQESAGSYSRVTSCVRRLPASRPWRTASKRRVPRWLLGFPNAEKSLKSARPFLCWWSQTVAESRHPPSPGRS